MLIRTNPRVRLRASFRALVLLLLAGSCRAADFQFTPGWGTDLTLTVELTPRVNAWERVGPNSYRGRDYQLTLEEAKVGARHELRVQLRRDSQQPFSVTQFRAVWTAARPDLFAVWTYNQDPHLHRNYRALRSETFGDLGTPNAGIPYALLAARDGRNIAAFGVRSQDQVVYLNGQPDSPRGYQVGMGYSTSRLTA